MDTLERFKRWWLTHTSPGDEVEPALAWRGYVLNSLLLSLLIFIVPYFFLSLYEWWQGQDDGGSPLVSFLIFVLTLGIFIVSRRKSISLAIGLFSGLTIAVSFTLSLGWGVGDIVGSAVYAAAIVQISLFLRGRTHIGVMATLIGGHLLIGIAELQGWLTPPFYTELSVNHINVTSIMVLLATWGFLTSQLIDRSMAAQVEEAARRQELESRTRIATEIQLSMLPLEPPDHPGYAVSGQSIPAREVGGDFYNYYQLSDGTLALVVGDVTGKGMPAALLMAVTLGIIDGLIPVFDSPAAMIRRVGQRLQQHTARNRLNAACLAAFFKGNSLRVANAGGIEPLIRRREGEVTWLRAEGLPLGAIPLSEGAVYRQAETTLRPGDMVIFVTDGVVESRTIKGDLLSFERLVNIVQAGPAHSAEGMKNHILRQLQVHCGQHERDDDVTVVVVQLMEETTYAP